MQKQKLSSLIVGKSNPISQSSFSERIIGTSRDASTSKLKNVSNRSFLLNQPLVFSYGLFRDADNDKKINAVDCFPFDSSKQDVPKFSDYSPQVQDRARELLNRKLQGKKIAPNNKEEFQAYQTLINEGSYGKKFLGASNPAREGGPIESAQNQEQLKQIRESQQAKNTVFIDGQGYTVRPEDQAKFIESQTRRTQVTETKLPPQKIPINPNTGRPYNVLTKAEPTPRLTQQYKEATRDRNPVVSSVSFALKKAREQIARIDERRPSSGGKGKGQDLFTGQTGERVQTIAEVGLYVNPYTGPSLALASGVGQFTKGGMKETERTAEELKKKYNVPSGITQAGIYGLATVSAVAGGRGVAKQIETAAGYPKYNTVFLTKQQGISQQENTVSIFSRDVALTEERNLFSKKTYLTGAQTETRLVPVSEGKYQFRTGTVGVSRDINRIDLITGRTKPYKPSKFGAVQTGEIEQAQLKRPLANGIFTDIEEGFTVKGVGKIKTGTKDVDKFAFMGVGGKLDENRAFTVLRSTRAETKTFGGVKYPKQGRGESIGVIERPQQAEDAVEYISSNLKQTKQVKIPPKISAVQEAQTKQAIEQSISATKKPSTYISKKGLSTITQGMKETSVKLASGLSQSQDTSLKQSQVSSLGQTTDTSQRQGAISVFSTSTRETQDVAPSLIQGVSQGQQQAQRQTPRTTTTLRNPLVSFSGETPTRGGAVAIPFLKKGFLDTSKPYDVFVYRDATKQNKARWIKKADNVNLITALSIGASDVDSSISSRFKVVQDDGKINENVKSNAWSRVGYKFREFMSRGGKRTKTPLTFYEKQKYRLDSSSEVMKIQTEKRRARRTQFRI